MINDLTKLGSVSVGFVRFHLYGGVMMASKSFLLSIAVVAVSILTVVSFLVYRTDAARIIDSGISAEIHYKDSPDVFQVQNVQVLYNWRVRSDYGPTADDYSVFLIYEGSAPGVSYAKDIPLSDIKQIDFSPNYNILLNDGSRIVPRRGLSSSARELLESHFPKGKDFYRSSASIVGDLVLEDGVGSFQLFLTSDDAEEIKSIQFTTPPEKYENIRKFSILLSQALRNYIQGNRSDAKANLSEAVSMCE